MTTRTIILHYHLFKNAGTSVDKILKDNFGGRWVTKEFFGTNNTAEVVDWIRDTPEAVAYSSHTMMGPLPRIADIRIVSLVFLRDPIKRIRSAYRFERGQQSDNFGAVLAKATDFEGYVRVRLSLPHDRQCRNFQTWRLASLVPGDASELERAKAALTGLDVIGLVDGFGASMADLKGVLEEAFPEFEYSDTRMNVSEEDRKTLIDSDVDSLLRENNRDDLALLDYASTLRN